MKEAEKRRHQMDNSAFAPSLSLSQSRSPSVHLIVKHVKRIILWQQDKHHVMHLGKKGMHQMQKITFNCSTG
jgi:hypothetical protein